MAFVTSVKRYTLTITAGNGTATSTIDGQDTTKCIPFVTTRLSIDSTTDGDHGAYAVDVSFLTGPDRIQVETFVTATREVVCEVTLVEFNSADVKVQEGTFAMTGTSEGITGLDSLGAVTDTFSYHTWLCNGVGTDYTAAQVRCNIDAVDDIQISRQASTGQCDGHIWLAEAIGGTPEFTVEHISVSFSGTTQETPAVTSVTENKTFIMASHKVPATATNFENDECTLDMFLASATSITADRQANFDDLYAVAQVVTFDAGNAATVRRGTLNQAAATASENIDITDLGSGFADVAMIHSTASTGSFTSGSFPGALVTDPVDAHCAWTFVDSDTINIQHNTDGGEASQDISWEVILWGDAAGGPAPRRVMVRA